MSAVANGGAEPVRSDMAAMGSRKLAAVGQSAVWLRAVTRRARAVRASRDPEWLYLSRRGLWFT